MKVGTVVGTLCTQRTADCLQMLTFLEVQSQGERLVAADLVGAKAGEQVLLATGRMAGQCTMEAPVDAAVVAIVAP